MAGKPARNMAGKHAYVTSKEITMNKGKKRVVKGDACAEIA